MYRKLIIPFFAAILSCPALWGQEIYDNPSVCDVRTKISAGVDWKIASGLSLSLSEKVRYSFTNNKVQHLITNLDLGYKFCDYAKVGSSYSFIKIMPQGAVHRAEFSVTGMYKTGIWHFSIKETGQFNHRTGDINTYQKPRNSVLLRSKAKVSLKLRSVPLEPYLGFEVRHMLNGVNPNSLSAVSSKLSDPKYTDVYLKRRRLDLGTEWRISRKNLLDFGFQCDWDTKKKLDATKAGKLKSITYQPACNISFCIAYKFKI